ncbi:MAG: LysM peptidoglycan-binding domain-containing protein [Pirellulales bacterium]
MLTLSAGLSMATEKRIALIAVILAAGLIGAFVFPLPAPTTPADKPAESTVHFRQPEESAPPRSTLLTPVESLHQPTAPTASTHGSLETIPPSDARYATAPNQTGGPPSFQPQLRPELPRLTDEPLFGEFMEPPGNVLPPGTLPQGNWPWPDAQQAATGDGADDLVPVAPRTSRPDERVGRQVVAPPLKLHVVRDGDTLTRLAQRYLGDPDRYREIFELNAATLDNPEILPLGAKIKIPSRERPRQTVSDEAATAIPQLYGTAAEADRSEQEAKPSAAINPLRANPPPLEPIRRN